MELEEYSRHLQFIQEYPLTTEPLRIDVVIIKKYGNIPIRKNIASIFRNVNIVEYKSPGGYVSIEDFYKVYGYACLYTTINKVPITSLTISFIESRYPRKLIQHLQKNHGYTVEEKCPGIYIVSGDVLPIQIIDSRKLPASQNLWLKSLSDKHDGFTISRINKEINKLGRTAQLQAYLYTIINANPDAIKEAIEMKKISKRLEQVFIETGLAAKWEARAEARAEARGVARGEQKIINMLKNGKSPEEIINYYGAQGQGRKSVCPPAIPK